MFKRSLKPDAVNFSLPRKMLRFRKRGPVTVIDFDGDHLRVVQAAPHGNSARVTRVVSAKFIRPEGKQDPDQLGAALKKALDEHRIKAKEVVFSIPRGQVVLRPLQVPMVAEVRELSSVVNFQIAKDLPFRLEEATVDFKVLRVLDAVSPPAEEAKDSKADPSVPAPAPQPRLDVLVGAIKSDIVAFHQALAKAAGLKLAGLGLRSTGLGRALEVCNQTDPENAVALVAVRQEEITVEVLAQNLLAFSRVAAVNLPGTKPAPESEASAEEFLNQLAVEVVRSLHSYDGMMWHKPVRKVLVVGITGLEPDIAAVLQERLSVPTTHLDPAACVQGRDTDRAEAAAGFAAIGLAFAALDPAGLPLDFAYPKRPPVQRNTRRIRMLVTAAAAVVLLSGIFSVRAHFVKKRLQVKQTVQQQLTDAEKKLPIYRRLKQQTKIVTNWLGEEQNWLDHLAYLSGILPAADQIYVSAINTTPQHVIRMSVQAKSAELLSELDKKLRAAGYEVKPLSITPASDKYGYNFRTTVELTLPKSLKPDPNKAKPPPRPADDASIKAASTSHQSSRQSS